MDKVQSPRNSHLRRSRWKLTEQAYSDPQFAPRRRELDLKQAQSAGREIDPCKGVLWFGTDCGARTGPRNWATRLFQKGIGAESPDASTKSWSLLYLARLADSQGDREQAQENYKAALAP